MPAFASGFSYLAGQRLSACTCASAEAGVDHPGPVRANGSFVGRGASEIDLIEATNLAASQSAQWAPFDSAYKADTSHMTFNLSTTEYATRHNSYIVRGTSALSCLMIRLIIEESRLTHQIPRWVD